jgi:hypothetical protein
MIMIVETLRTCAFQPLGAAGSSELSLAWRAGRFQMTTFFFCRLTCILVRAMDVRATTGRLAQKCCGWADM